jgi:hypothetical protein
MHNIRITAHHSDASSTVNLQTSTGNELCLITGQKQTVVRYINGICQASEWDVEQEFLEVLFGGGDADEGFESAFVNCWRGDVERGPTSQFRSREDRRS